MVTQKQKMYTYNAVNRMTTTYILLIYSFNDIYIPTHLHVIELCQCCTIKKCYLPY